MNLLRALRVLMNYLLLIDHELSQLNTTDLDFVNNWVNWGFNRGLRAEYRAWLSTFQIYQSLVDDSIIPRLNWIDSYLNNQNSLSNEFECRLFNDLNQMQKQTFSMPELNSPLLKEAILHYTQLHNLCSSIQNEATILEQ